MATSPIIHISANQRDRIGQLVRDLWIYRELLWTLAQRDIKIRYKQTVLGVAWVVLNPLMVASVFALIFGRFAKLPSEHQPYLLFALAGLIPWSFFASVLTRGSVSLVNNSNLIAKVYFPRQLIPIAAVLDGLVDVLVGIVGLLLLMPCFGLHLSLALLSLPFFILMAAATALAVNLWLSALYVRYRDVSYLIPFLVQFWMFATPVAYSATLIPERWRFLYGLNPMTGVVEGFRWAVFGQTQAPGLALAISLAMVGLLLIGGLLFFRHVERRFADIL